MQKKRVRATPLVVLLVSEEAINVCTFTVGTAQAEAIVFHRYLPFAIVFDGSVLFFDDYYYNQ